MAHESQFADPTETENQPRVKSTGSRKGWVRGGTVAQVVTARELRRKEQKSLQEQKSKEERQPVTPQGWRLWGPSPRPGSPPAAGPRSSRCGSPSAWRMPSRARDTELGSSKRSAGGPRHLPSTAAPALPSLRDSPPAGPSAEVPARHPAICGRQPRPPASHHCPEAIAALGEDAHAL